MGDLDKNVVSIEGTLLMLDDATPHVAVAVQAIRDGKVIATVLSDGSGKYQFANLEPGEYQLRCQVLNGYVYYKMNGKLTTSQEDDTGDVLQLEYGEAIRNINFRFAPFKKGTWRNYTYLDGLMNDEVHAIYCDPEGIMWFGTSGGVSRYNGKEFMSITTKDGLVHNRIDVIFRDPDGVMWFGGFGGVSRYDGKNFTNFTTENGLTGCNVVRAIHRDPDGVMWFATGMNYLGGVSRYDGREFVKFSVKDGLAYDNVHAIHQNPDGMMWFGTFGGGVSRYDGKTFFNITAEDGLANNNVDAIYRDLDGMMWFGTLGGVSRYDGRKFTNFNTQDGLVSNYIHAIYRDSDGVMWFGTEGGVSRYDGKTFVNFTEKDELANNWVRVIQSGPDGAMWFGTWGGGASRHDAKAFANLTTKDGLADNSVNAIHCDSDGMMWFGTSGGLSRYDGNEFVNFTTEDGLPYNSIGAIHCDPDGMMWFGIAEWWGKGGISRYDGKTFANLTTEAGLTFKYCVYAIYRDPNGIIWFGTGFNEREAIWGEGISRYDGNELVTFTIEDGLAGDSVRAIYRTPDGMMWFGTKGGGVSQYDGRKFINLTTEDGLAHNYVNAIHQDPDGVMWFGTDGGVSRYDGNEFVNFTTQDGLGHNFVNSIYQDTNGVMWFGTEGGVSAYDGIAWTSLDPRDGLAGKSVTSIIQDSDGYLWFGTERGVTRYRRSTMQPKVYIVSVTTDQTYCDLYNIPAFTSGTRVTIEYGSIDFKTLPEKRQYRHRIQASGMDTDWNKPTKATLFDYTFDQPDTYTFEVQAIDRDLNYSEPALVKLQVISDPRNHRISLLEEQLREHERAEMDRIYQELEDARQIQQSLQPEGPPEVLGFEIAGVSIPAREVSGDFYTYLSLGANTGIVLADVTGKSVKAAMVAAMTDGMLHSEVEAHEYIQNSPSEILYRLNIGLQPRLINRMNTAMSLSVLHTAEKRLIFSNAGMPYPIVKRGKESCELEVNGMPLGLMSEAEYQDMSFNLREGDYVVYCSDGVIEAANKSGEMYQTERLLELIQQADPGITAQDMVDLILKDVTAYVRDEEPSDDITIVILRCK